MIIGLLLRIVHDWPTTTAGKDARWHTHLHGVETPIHEIPGAIVSKSKIITLTDSLFSTFFFKDCRKSPQKNLKVQPKRLIFDISDIQSATIIEINITAS